MNFFNVAFRVEHVALYQRLLATKMQIYLPLSVAMIERMYICSNKIYFCGIISTLCHEKRTICIDVQM